jgi:hypothetical protein
MNAASREVVDIEVVSVAPNPRPLVTFESVTKTYGHLVALRDVSFALLKER